MRYHLILLAALLASASPATAQVTVDLRALDALPATRPAAPAPPRHVVRRPAPTEARRKPVARAATAAAKPAAPKPVVAAVHPAAPPPAATPTVAKPAAAKPASAAAPVAPSAASAPKQTAAAAPAAMPLPSMNAAPPPVAQLTPIRPNTATPAKPPQQHANKAAAVSNGLKVSFPPGKADLSPDGAAAIKRLVASAHTSADTTYNVVAYAAGTAGDPSVARRLSLSRALAVRGALMADGVNSARIYVRAMGANVPSGPPDRVDVTLQGGNDPSQ